ncbi:MAG: LacI family DNA-binding transcriptional regulator [Pseudomonadota bacterium]
MDRRPTIIDVAKEASVSKSTVSLVLQNSPAVKAETRAEVRKAMARLGYVYNRSAANLRSSKTGLIGLIINDLRNPFFTEFAASLQKSLAEQNHAVVLADIQEDPKAQAKMIGALIEHGVSGFVISPAYGGDPDAFQAIERAGIALIQVFRKIDDRGDLFPFIAPDYQFGSRIATEHLLQSSRGEVAFVGGLADRSVTEERMSGYLDLMKARVQPPIILTGATGFEFGFQAVSDLLQHHPKVDAALCFNDQVALGLVAGASHLGVSVPQQLRVVGFDDIEGCRHSLPQLSSVSCGIPDFAEKISQYMLSWIIEQKPPLSGEKTDVELLIRGSSRLDPP